MRVGSDREGTYYRTGGVIHGLHGSCYYIRKYKLDGVSSIDQCTSKGIRSLVDPRPEYVSVDLCTRLNNGVCWQLDRVLQIMRL